MEISVKPGKYVLAVSGGVDSMALLHLLAQRPEVKLVVAHFDHGIRHDSGEDRALVQTAAERYGLPFVVANGNLGPRASEATAREVRYNFLRQARAEHSADAIITAHHQDDQIETALINMLRGTGPRGLASLRSTDNVLRPLLHIPKASLHQYAVQQGLQWREDSTNHDERYLRNYIRLRILPKLQAEDRVRLIRNITETAALQTAIEQEFAPYVSGDQLERAWFIQLPYGISTEAMAAWLRKNQLQFDRKGIHRLTVFAKTAHPGKRADIDAERHLLASKNHITLTHRKRTG
jgi:tRNA(Ile)-lysidine synthase